MSARAVLLVTLLAMGAALLLTAWSSRRAVLAASSTVVRGQAETLVQATREQLRNVELGDDELDLESFLRDQESGGLRYVALLGAEGEVLASAGVASGSVATGRPAGPGFSMEMRDELVRVVAAPPRPPGRDARRPPPEGRRPRREGARGARDERRPPPPRRAGRFDPLAPPPGPEGRGRQAQRQPDLLLEFEPLVAAGLERQATRTLVFGAAAAIALTAAAFASWTLLGQRERAERRLAEHRRLASLGEMSAVLAHEIRNPLASLKGHAQLLVERLPDGSPERRGAERVISEAKRLEQLASSLLDFVRTASVAREPSRPAELLQECADAVGASRVDVEASQAPESWSLDPLRLRQVLRNLIENAVQASPDDARVEATCRTRGQCLVFEILDRGDGLPPGGADPLFEPFHTTRTTGTGLGLAVARRVAELHGGTISARNRPGGGAVFRVELPAEHEEA